MEIKWMVEIDDYCNKVLEKHWPDVRRYRDVREIHGVMAHADSGRCQWFCDEPKSKPDVDVTALQGSFAGKQGVNTCSSCLEPVDIICGGFPCQPFSAAGKRRGKDDDRNLWPEFKRIIAEVRPRWVVAENVVGLRTLYLDQVLSDLEGLGYSTATVVIPACAFDAPHRRDRLWIVAGRKEAYVDDPKEKRRRMGGTYKSRANQSDVNAPNDAGQNVAFTQTERLQRDGAIGQQVATTRQQETQPEGGFETLADSEEQPIWPGLRQGESRRQRGRRLSDEGGQTGTYWTVEPSVGRVAHGIPARVDRLKALGNAVVPAVTEHIARMIIEVENSL